MVSFAGDRASLVDDRTWDRIVPYATARMCETIKTTGLLNPVAPSATNIAMSIHCTLCVHLVDFSWTGYLMPFSILTLVPTWNKTQNSLATDVNLVTGEFYKFAATGSVTQVTWLPLIVVGPFTRGTSMLEVWDDLYRNLVLQMGEQGLLGAYKRKENPGQTHPPARSQ
jgi:hypothetical protein